MIQPLPNIEFSAWLEKLVNSAQATLVTRCAELKKPMRRAQTLREYMLRMVEAPVSHVDEGIFLREELVLILLCAAMYVYRRKKDGNEEIPS